MATILVVDDDADILELVSFKLSRAGHTVHCETDGEVGLSAVAELRPDLVLLDWMMPRLSGLEVCMRLRGSDATAAIPVILLTAKAQDGDVERGFAAGVDDYIRKPFSTRELLSRVEELLGRAGAA